MNLDKYIFTHEMKVRDYECDLQGIVNNANYQHYMEHSRHYIKNIVIKSYYSKTA